MAESWPNERCLGACSSSRLELSWARIAHCALGALSSGGSERAAEVADVADVSAERQSRGLVKGETETEMEMEIERPERVGAARGEIGQRDYAATAQ